MRIIFQILIVSHFFCFGLYGQSEKCEGTIESVSGTGWLKAGKRPTEKITFENRQKFHLVTDNIVGADSGSRIELRLSCVARLVPVKSKTFYIVGWGPTPPKGGRLPDVDNAGGNRGSNDFILFPFQDGEPNLSVVRPESAEFWWGKPIGEKLELRLSVAGRKTPFLVKPVESKPRHYSSAELREELRKIRETDPGARIKLEIKDTRGNPSTSIFRLFSLLDERSLQKRLDDLKGEKGIFGNLARAEIYREFRLYNLAAQEYERALKRSPGDIYLLLLTGSAQDDAGNLQRRDEINRILEPYSHDVF
jgi:hypothetical protein